MKKLLFLFLLTFLFSGKAHAQNGFRYDSFAINQNGQPITNASIKVCAGDVTSGPVPCTTSTPVYSNIGLSIPITQPFTTGPIGNYGFYAAPGTYTISFYGANITGGNSILTVPCAVSSSCAGVGGSPGSPSGSLQGNNAGSFGGVPGSSIDFSNGDITLAPTTAGLALTVTGAVDGEAILATATGDSVGAIEADQTGVGGAGIFANSNAHDTTGQGQQNFGSQMFAQNDGSDVDTDVIVGVQASGVDNSTGGSAALVAGLESGIQCQATSANCYGILIQEASGFAGLNNAGLEIEPQGGQPAIDTDPSDPSFLGLVTAATMTVSNLTASTNVCTDSGSALATSGCPLIDLSTGVTGQLPITAVGSAGLSASLPIAIDSAGNITCSTCGTGTGNVLSSGTPSNGQLAQWTNSTTIQGVAATLASALFANQGTTVTVLHGNAAGNPSWAVVTPSDAAGNTSGSGNFVLATSATLVTPALGTPSAINLANATFPSSVCLPGSFAAQTDGTTVTWAIGSAICANASLTFTAHGGSRTLNITGPVNGGSYVLWIKQDGTGSEGLTLGTGCTWKVGGGGSGAITPSTAANAIDILAFTYDGTNCYLNFNKNFN